MAHRFQKLEHEKVTHKPRAGKTHPIQAVMRKFADGKITPEAAHSRLERFGWSRAILSAGQLALEQAVHTKDIEQASVWLTKASRNFGKVLLQSASTGDVIVDPNGALASLNQAQLPNYASFIASNELPGGIQAEKALKSTIDSANKIRNGLVELSDRRGQEVIKRELSGVLAEADVLALGQRYALKEHPDRSWFPLLALHSDDHHDWRKSLAHEAWDITIYTQLGQTPEPSYKLQVKSSERAFEYDQIDYSLGGVETVCVDPDLKLREESFLVGRIAMELYRESIGDTYITRDLDQRTEKLLDILG